MRPTLLYRAYTAAATVLLPFAFASERQKVLAEGLSPTRAAEKLGKASAPRPGGRLLWFHAASVGESLSVLSLITRMGARMPDAHFLITSGTPTSARIIARRLPPRTIHQFAPLDSAGPVRRFFRHWRPDAGIFVESELWPQLVWRAHGAGVPLALIGARMSETSQKGWQRRPKTAAQLLSAFCLIQTQTEPLARMLRALGGPENTAKGLNLKALSAPLPVDDALLAKMRESLGARPVWVAASTHPGEERQVLRAHGALLKRYPDLCLLLVPRHPDRAPQIIEEIEAQAQSFTSRSKGEPPTGAVFLADSLGEMGTWYALAPIVCVGGAFEPIGGHNPFEPAQAGAAVLSGPYVANFQEVYDTMCAMGAALIVEDMPALATQLDRLLSDGALLAQARARAAGFAQRAAGDLDMVAADLETALGLTREDLAQTGKGG